MSSERRNAPRFSVRQIVEIGFGRETVLWADAMEGEHHAAIKFPAFHGNGSTGLDRFLKYLGMKPLLATEGRPTQSNRRRSR